MCVCVCVCVSLRYTACKQHLFCTIFCCHLWPVQVHHIFPHYLINSTIFWKKLLNIQCMFWFSLQLLSEAFLILITIWWDIFIDIHTFSSKVYVIHQILIKLEFYWQIFDKSSNREFYENPSSGSQVAPCRLTDRQTDRDRHTWRNCRFLQFCQRA